MATLAGFEIVPGLIHVFAPDGGAHSIADFTDYDTNEKVILWAFGVFGASQIFNGLLYLIVLFNIFDTRYLAMPLLVWSSLKGLWSVIVPKLMGRDLKTVAPNAPGNYKALLTCLLSIFGIADEIVTKADIFEWYI